MKKQTIDKRIGEIIKLRRANLGLSQSAVAQSMDITFQQVQKYEKGANSLNISRFVEISAALGVSPTDLLGAALESGAPDIGETSNRAILEMIKRFRLLTKAEQAAISAFIKTLCAKGVAA